MEHSRAARSAHEDAPNPATARQNRSISAGTSLTASSTPVTEAGEIRGARGASVLAETQGPRRATILVTGTEVALTVQAGTMPAAEGIEIAAVSMPCRALFGQRSRDCRAAMRPGRDR